MKILYHIILLFLVATTVNLFAQSEPDSQIYHYRIDFLFIPSVNLTMKVTYIEKYQNHTVTRLEFTTNTNKFFSHIFEVHNSYISLYDPNDFTILFSQKIINQTNVQQTIIATYTDTEVNYSNQRSMYIPSNTHNFFSLIMHCRELSIHELEKKMYFVECEGSLYEATFKNHGEEILNIGNKGIFTDKIEIILFPLNPDRPSFFDSTDVFNWKVASSEGKRLIWIEKDEPRRIIKCEFHLSPLWLTAKLTE